MARVIADLIDGEVRLSSAGDSARRLFQVQELSGAASARLLAATTASGVPKVGDAHPALSVVRVTDVRASATNDPTVATVEVSYGLPLAGTTAIGGAVDASIVSDLITEETLEDVNGNRTVTSYFTVTFNGATSTGTNTQQIHRIEVVRPTFTVALARAEKSTPLATARAYAGRVNQSVFMGEPADSWMCNVESTQERDGLHRVRYSFTLNASGWQARVYHQSGGVVPNDVTDNNGIATVQVYERADFNALGLPRL